MIPKNFKLKSLHWVFLSILMIATIASAFHTSSARSTGSATVFVDPQQTILTGATVGTTFQVNITVANITGFVGSEVHLAWNATLLNCTSIQENLFHAVTPTDSWSNINPYLLKVNKTAGTADYAVTFLDISGAISAGYAPINVTTTNYPSDGKLALAVLNFTVASVPPTNTYLDCNFTFTGVIMGDQNADQIPTVNVDGYYRIYGPPETVTSSVLLNGTSYDVITLSNATVVPDSMTYIANWTLSFNLTAAPNGGTTAYVNVTIPKNLIALANETTDTWNITINGTSITPIVTEDITNTYLYFTTGLSTKTVTIVGTIPELPVLMIIPLLMIVTLIAVGLRRRRQI
jgi:hypothetical protein